MAQSAEKTPSTRFGWALDRRLTYFDDVRGTSSATSRVTFTGVNLDLPILHVPIDLPKYRLLNGRTSSTQQEYIARNPGTSADFFRKDPELNHVQEVQHKLLSELIRAAGLHKKFEDPANRQVEALILDENGFVINGNRRLCAWRNLFHSDPSTYGHFSHIDVIVLPHADDKEIDRLEGKLQVEKDIRADYTWDSLANMMLQRQSLHNLSDEELAELYELKVNEVRALRDMRAYAEEYLTSRGKAGLWSEVSEHELAFRKLVERRQSAASVGEKELLKTVAYVLIDNPDEVGGRLYEAIPNVQKYMNAIRKELQSAFPVPKPAKRRDDLFGGQLTPGSDVALAATIAKGDNGKKAREIIRDVIQTQKTLQRDAESAAYLLKLLTRANGQLESAVASALRPETAKTGVEEQLKQIEVKIQRIRDWLDA